MMEIFNSKEDKTWRREETWRSKKRTRCNKF